MTTSQWKDEGKKIAEQIDDSLREISALKKIRDADEISEDIYEKLFKERRNVIEELYDKVENLITIMAERIKVLESRILDYTVFLANINMNKILGEVDEEAYETSKRELSKYLSRINLEKQDLEKTINALKIYIDNSRSQEAISAISTHSIPITIKIKEAEGV